MKKATYETGLEGEDIAEQYLVNLGFRTIEKRHREKTGEIDLIMEEGKTLVFVEVKARFSEGRAGEDQDDRPFHTFSVYLYLQR